MVCIGLFQKKIQTGWWEWGWGHGISQAIKERACWNSRGQLKMKWNFQQWSRKIHVEFPLVLVFCLGISKGCHTTLWNIQRWSFAFSRISKGLANPKMRRFDFFWNSTFRRRCLHMLRNQSMVHEIFCFAKIKSLLNVLKH